MATLATLFDRDLFTRMVEEKYVRLQTHPVLPLAILNYTEKAQYDREWNDVTLNSRGLIYDYSQHNLIVARGFKKFFNWDDSSQPYPPQGVVVRSPKMDGSLGIMYPDSTRRFGWAIATRGSFTSDQALWATRKLEDRLDSLQEDGEPTYPFRIDRSYLFEIIYPDNRIVVDYGSAERLVLLDVLDTETGEADLEEFDTIGWPDRVEKRLMPEFKDTMAHDIPQGEEGFVFYWPARDFRVKMKAAEYIELHRMIFGMNARTVWERLGNGETPEDIAVQLPDEFHQWVNDIATDLYRQQTDILLEVHRRYGYLKDQLPREYTRKEFAELAVKEPLRGYLFMFEDGKEIRDEIWKSIRPAGNVGITAISEDVA